jgi:predicted nucleic acid-binding protein
VIVVDASIIANALVDSGQDGNTARAALRRDAALAAPDLIDVETVSVWRKRWLAGDLTAQRFRVAIDDLGDLPLDRYPTLPLMWRAYELRNNVSPYDAAYVTLAEVLGCALVTADSRLARAPGIRCEVDLVTR